jgi:hypothetical protein
MTVKYEYKSACCGNTYVEQRGKDEPMIFPICNACGQGNYELVNETVLADKIEREIASEVIDVEEIQPIPAIDAPTA